MKVYAIGCHENNGNNCTLGDCCWAQDQDDVTRSLAAAQKGAVGWSGVPYVLDDSEDWEVEWYEENPEWGRLIVPGEECAISMTPVK